MNPTSLAVRAGWTHGPIELRQSFANGGDLFGHLFWPVAMLVDPYFMSDTSFGSSGAANSSLTLRAPSNRPAPKPAEQMGRNLRTQRAITPEYAPTYRLKENIGEDSLVTRARQEMNSVAQRHRGERALFRPPNRVRGPAASV